MAAHVLVVDDDDDTAEALSELLVDEGYRVTTRTDARSALDCVQNCHPAIVLCDVRMPGMDLRSFIGQCRRTGRPGPSVILVSGIPRIDEIAEREGADGFVQKPFRIEDVVRRIQGTFAMA